MDQTVFWAAAIERYPKDATRIQRGRDILERHLQDPQAGIIVARTEHDGFSFRVRSQHNPRGAYVINHAGCTCPDWPTSHRCKHFVAVTVLARLMGVPLA